jgi:hypothetical protein
MAAVPRALSSGLPRHPRLGAARLMLPSIGAKVERLANASHAFAARLAHMSDDVTMFGTCTY